MEKKLGETRLVVWWFYVKSRINASKYQAFSGMVSPIPNSQKMAWMMKKLSFFRSDIEFFCKIILETIYGIKNWEFVNPYNE